MDGVFALRIVLVFIQVFVLPSLCVERCFDCQNAPYPRDCARVTICGDDEYCSVQQVVTSSGTILYNIGCMARSRCDLLANGKRNILEETLAREDRSVDITTCVECCQDDLCNNQGCGAEAIPRDQRGPYCYSCDAVLDPSKCNTVTLCSEHEECLLYSPSVFSGHPETVYSGICESSVACKSLATTSQDPFCPPMCCKDDFCNTKCGTRNVTVMSTPPVHSAIITTTSAGPVTTVYQGSVVTTDTVTMATNPPVVITTNPPAASLATDPTSNCPPSHFYDDLSQVCIRVVDQSMTYDEAKQSCESNGERLFVADTHEKMVFLENMLLRHSGLEMREQYYWIGLRKAQQGDPFLWADGQKLQYTYWGGHDEFSPNEQPDNSGDQNCVLVLGEDHYMWHDDVCSSTRAFICEMTSVTPPAVTGAVPTCDTTGGYEFLQSGQTSLCVHVHTNRLNWDSARAACQNENGDLVVLDTPSKALLMKEHIKSNYLTAHESIWLGARDFQENDVFRWVDDTVVDLIDGDWNSGQPNHFDAGHVQNCANMWLPDDLRWHDDRCDKSLGFICERRP